jgi:hypothetical protein
MTLADLDRKTALMERLRREEWAKILPRIESSLADAHAHATKAITDSLKGTGEGRATARKANRSSSFRAALSRLDELWEWLAGPSVASLDGRLRDAREAAYRRAFAIHKGLVPEELWVSADPAPTLINIRLVRGALLHGYDLRRELEGPFALAKRRLSAAVATAGHREVTRAVEKDLLKVWYTKTLDAIRSASLRALTDSIEFADNQAGRDLIHPDYLSTGVA